MSRVITARTETLDAQVWEGQWHTVARFSDTDVDTLPSITFVKSDGTVLSTANGWHGWTFRIGADSRRLEFKKLLGTTVVIR